MWGKQADASHGDRQGNRSVRVGCAPRRGDPGGDGPVQRGAREGAGVLLAGEGLQPSSRGVRVRYSGSERTVIDGPFTEAKELVAGFWLWRVRSLDEAIAWARRCPNPMPGSEGEIEIRPVMEADDFGDALTPELRDREERLRSQVAPAS